MKNKLILSCVVAVLGAFGANGAPKFQNIHLIPGNEAIGGKVTVIKNSQRWTADTIYILDRLTFVEAPAVLTIEPGTIVRMEQKTTGGTSVTDPADVGTLIICRGAKIVANGTAESPIIFTNIDDPFDTILSEQQRSDDQAEAGESRPEPPSTLPTIAEPVLVNSTPTSHAGQFNIHSTIKPKEQCKNTLL